MKFSEYQLRALFEGTLTVTTEELCHQLTMLGLEVEACEAVAPAFTGVVVGEVMTAAQHPNADRLRVYEVNVGSRPLLNIVCGAPNARAGIKVAVSQLGAVLPGGFVIKETKLRGVLSQGMLCSERELGLPETIDGILELPLSASIGLNVRDYLVLNDHIITINLTPNRGDCLSLYGIARELAVLNALALPQLLAVHPFKEEQALFTSKMCYPVAVQAEQACPAYFLALVEGVDNTVATPLETKMTLERCGVRSISPVVDILNEVMLLCGQPMHAFDRDKVKGGIDVTWAKEGDKITLLNEETVTLRHDTLTIRDAKGTIALAGIMGDGASAVATTSNTLLIEAAFFDPLVIAGKARSYGLHTDSSHRFERGVDPLLPLQALALALEKIKVVTGGHCIAITGKQAEKYFPKAHPIVLREEKIERLLGVKIEPEFIQSSLQGLGCIVTAKKAGEWQVQAPSFRFDLTREEDLIEELIRLQGYDSLPLSLPQMALNQHFAPEKSTSLHQIKTLLNANGFFEVVTYSFIDEALQESFFAEKQYVLANPITKELAAMRKSLIPSLLAVLKYNLNRQQKSLAIFEAGERFIGLPPVQEEVIAGLIYGNDEAWYKPSAADFYSMKGMVEKLAASSRIPLEFKAEGLPSYIHPGQGLSLFMGHEKVGYLGALHPELWGLFDVKDSPFVFELANKVFKQGLLPLAEPISKFPFIERDIAFIIAKTTAVAAMLKVARGIASPILQQVSVFDVYEDRAILQDKKSVAMKLRLQALDRTLTDGEVDEVVSQVIAAVTHHCDAVLRDG